MDQRHKKLVFKKFPQRLVLIPLVSLLALAGIYLIHPEESKWILSAAVIWGVLTIVCLIIFVLRPLRSLLADMEEVDSHNREMQGQLQDQALACEKVYIEFNQVNQSVQHLAQQAIKVRELTGIMLEKIVNETQQEIKVLSERNQFLVNTKEFKQLIEVIRDIAYQTNLLSMDAAIIAVRGGENLEVAAEFKNLAKRITNFSQEMEGLIAGDLELTKLQLFSETQVGGILQQTVSEIQETAGLVTTVALNLVEQAAMLEQLEGVVDQLNQIAQVNAIISRTEKDQQERLVLSKIFRQISFRET